MTTLGHVAKVIKKIFGNAQMGYFIRTRRIQTLLLLIIGCSEG